VSNPFESFEHRSFKELPETVLNDRHGSFADLLQDPFGLSPLLCRRSSLQINDQRRGSDERADSSEQSRLAPKS
jgi:hypothetical protein